MMTDVAMGGGPLHQPCSSTLILTALCLQILLGVPTESRFVGAKNKKIHKFFDDSDDSYIDLPVEEEEEEEKVEAGFHSSSTSTTLSSMKRTTAAKYQEKEEEEEEQEEEEEEVDDSMSSEKRKGSRNVFSSSSSSSSSSTSSSYSSADLLLDDSKNDLKAVDPCLGIRCRIGRVCRVNEGGGDGFIGAWCVCAEADHCLSHGQRSERSSSSRMSRRMRRDRVCGSDGRFYPSHCEMHRVACVKNERIRMSHNGSVCIINGRGGGGGKGKGGTLHQHHHHQHHQHHQQQQATDALNSHEEQIQSALPLPTKPADVSSTTVKERSQQSVTTVVGIDSAATGVPLSSTTSGQCTEVEYEKFVEDLLQADCIRLGNRNCADSQNRHQSTYDVMFSYYDNDMDQQLDIAELDAADERQRPRLRRLLSPPMHHLSTSSSSSSSSSSSDLSATTCRLRDLIRFGDKDLDLALTLTEFYAALRVSGVVLDKDLKVFLTSATVGTGLQLKCDIRGTRDYVWKRNGQLVGGASSSSSSSDDDDLTDKIKVFDDGSLYISDVSLYHVGNYSCQDRQNDDVSQVHVVSVRVPPIVQIHPKTRFVASGSTFTIRCHVEGVPIPDVSWIANEMPLSHRPDHYTLLHDGLTLQIRDADYTVDSGTFKCHANNYVGSSEDVATVFVENPNALHTAYSDELYQLFVVFHDEGFGVYEPGHCHIHHVVKGDFKVAPRDVNGQPVNLLLCDDDESLLRNGTMTSTMTRPAFCVWGAAVNVKNRFIYVTQPNLNRVIVVEVQDRFNPVEIIPVDGSPVEIAYVEHLDQVWVSCATAADNRPITTTTTTTTTTSSSSSGGSESESLSKTLLVIQHASADVHHSIIHTQPIKDKFDVVKQLFLPPANAFRQTSDYGYVVREDGGEGGEGGGGEGGGRGGGDDRLAVHKIDLNSMKYVKRLDDFEKNGCTPNRLAFIPLAGKIFANCEERASSDDATLSSNLSSCFTIDYVTDKAVVAADLVPVTSCGDPYVSPDSRHLVIIKDNRKSLSVYHVNDDGSMDLAFDEAVVDMHIGDVTFFATTDRTYDLFAKAIDHQSVVLYMNLASGHMETIKEGIGQWRSSDDDQSLPTNSGRFLPIVNGGVFSDYLLTPSTDTLYVIDARRRQVQCQWQEVRHATVVTSVQVSNR